MPSTVIRPRPAASEEALAHFQRLLKFETDCWDVHYALHNDLTDFVLLDVRAVEVARQGKATLRGLHFCPMGNKRRDII